MNRKVLQIAGVIVLVFIPSVWASQQQGEPNIPATLQEYLRYAAHNNAGLKAAFEQWKAALEQVPQAGEYPKQSAMKQPIASTMVTRLFVNTMAQAI